MTVVRLKLWLGWLSPLISVSRGGLGLTKECRLAKLSISQSLRPRLADHSALAGRAVGSGRMPLAQAGTDLPPHGESSEKKGKGMF